METMETPKTGRKERKKRQARGWERGTRASNSNVGTSARTSAKALREPILAKIRSAMPNRSLGPDAEKVFVLQSMRNNPLNPYWSWRYYSCAPSHTCPLAEQELQIQHTAARPSPAASNPSLAVYKWTHKIFPTSHSEKILRVADKNR